MEEKITPQQAEMIGKALCELAIASPSVGSLKDAAKELVEAMAEINRRTFSG